MAKSPYIKRPTSGDVARLAGVSRTTVSLVINDDPKANKHEPAFMQPSLSLIIIHTTRRAICAVAPHVSLALPFLTRTILIIYKHLLVLKHMRKIRATAHSSLSLTLISKRSAAVLSGSNKNATMRSS